jgi:hypothetical protein
LSSDSFSNFHARSGISAELFGTSLSGRSLARGQEAAMKPIAMLGVLLIVLGIAGLFLSHVTWTETKPVVKLGPLQVNSQEDHTIWIPTAAGVAAVLAGVGLVFAGKRAA